MDYSSLDWKWAIALANRGHDAYGIAKVLKQKPRGNKPAYSIKYLRILESKGLDRADAYAMKTAENAVAWVKEHPLILDRTAGRAALAQMRQAADSLDWLTYGGPGPRRALEGLFVMGDRLGSISFKLASRTWAELVGMNVPTLLRRRASLFELGWLRRNPRDRKGRTARYVLGIPDKIEWYGSADSPRDFLEAGAGGPGLERPVGPGGGLGVGDSAGTPPVPTYPSISLHPCELNGTQYLAHDAFRPSALGDLGWYAVSSELHGHDLDDLLHRLATEFRTTGAADRDKERHDQDRVKSNEYRANLKAATDHAS